MVTIWLTSIVAEMYETRLAHIFGAFFVYFDISNHVASADSENWLTSGKNWRR